jgi:acetyl esterase/lipase
MCGAGKFRGLVAVLGLAACSDPVAVDHAPSSAVVLADVSYCSGLAMDVYYPDASTPSPRIALIFVHGGMWIGGDKTGGDVGAYDFPRLANKGFTVFAINYRLGRGIIPEQVEDIGCAVRHVRASASMYRVKPDHIGMWGHSAGGHLAALFAATADSASRVQALVTYSAPFDLTALEDFDAQVATDIASIFTLEQRTEASVPQFASTAPPVLIFHGTLDQSIGLGQPEKMVAALQAAGVPVTYTPVVNGGHYLTLMAKHKKLGLVASPSRQTITNQVAAFFNAELGK